LDGLIEGFDEQLVVERLPQDGECTCLQRPFTHIHLVMGGDEDNWERVFTTD
jgi:BarA-like signal transduction histidine kinase